MPARVVIENDTLLVIEDIHPKAPIHYLLIPKVHYKDLQSMDNCNIGCSLLSMARTLSSNIPHASDYRLVINNGYNAGQRVFHLHMHFLAGSGLVDTF